MTMNTRHHLVSLAIMIAACIVLTTGSATVVSADDNREVSLSITLKGKGTDTPIKNASVYVKFKEKRRFRRDKKREWSLKTGPDGHVRFPRLPEGRALIQIVAEGWRTYGKFHKIEGEEMELVIELERPPKWF